MKFVSTSRRLTAFVLYMALTFGAVSPGFAQGRGAPPRGSTGRALGSLNRGGARPSGPIRRSVLPGNGRYLPADITARSLNGVKGFDAAKSRIQVGGPFGSNVAEQVVDITNFAGTGGQRLVSDEIDPFWTADEQSIIFASNRDNNGDGQPDTYQLWRVAAGSADNPSAPGGSDAVRLSGDLNSNHRFPVINPGGTRIAYLKSAGTGNYQLYQDSVPAGTGTLPAGSTSITANQRIEGRLIVSVGRPGWISASEIIFSAVLEGDTAADLFVYDILGNTFRRLTVGAADEQNVTVSPDGQFIAFDANAAGYSAAAPATATGTAGVRNVFAFTLSGTDAKQLTGGFAGMPAAVDSVQPSFSRAAVTPIFNPNNTNYYLAFSSNRRQNVDATTGAITYVRTNTNDIYYTQVNVTANTPGTGTTALIPEDAPGAFGGAIRFETADAASLYNDQYPTWAPLVTQRRLSFFSDRKGSSSTGFTRPNPDNAQNRNDIFVASLVDINAPTLLRYNIDSDTGDIVRVNLGDTYNGNPISLSDGVVRNRTQGITPGSTLFFTVRVSDLESGMRPDGAVYLQFKNPNGKYQSAAQGGAVVEHKEYRGNRSGLLAADSAGTGFNQFGIDPIDDGTDVLAFINWEVVDNTAYPVSWEPFDRPVDPDYSFIPGHPTLSGVNVGTEYEAEVVSASRSQNSGAAAYFKHRFNRLNYKRTNPSNYWTAFRGNGDATSVVNPDPGFARPQLANGSTLVGMYEAGYDDLFAFSGSSFPAPLDPDTNQPIWLELKPLPAAQQDSKGGVLYGASWRTPSEGSDWYIDVICYDNAVNPFDTTQQSNWIIYDNVWGFSSALPLNPQAEDVLVVSDYMLGQKFFRSRLGTFLPGQVQAPQNNLNKVEFGAESYFTDRDVQDFPDGAVAPSAAGTNNNADTAPRRWDDAGPFSGAGGPLGSPNGVAFVGTPNTLGVGSYVDSFLINEAVAVDTNPVEGLPRYLPNVGRYTIWRILSRGPVPNLLLNDYLPSRAATPPDARAGETASRTTIISNRVVVWAQPFSLTTFRGAGTILDLDTQNALTDYVNNGGRLFLSGQDIAFALSGQAAGGGGQASPFLSNVMGAQFLSDNAGRANQLTAGTASRINSDPFGAAGTHQYVRINGATSSFDKPNEGTMNIATNAEVLPASTWIGGDASFTATAAAGNEFLSQGFLDVVTPVGANAVAEFSIGGGAAIVSNQVGNGGRTVFASIGFESLSNGYYTYTPPGQNQPVHIANKGRRAEIMHNITCSFRTGTLVGRLIDDTGAPVADALVRAVTIGGNPAAAAAGTAVTDSNGNYQIIGLEAGGYSIQAFRAGYYTQAPALGLTHGASRNTVNVQVKRAGPGRFGGAPIPGNGTSAARPYGGVFRVDGTTGIGDVTILIYRKEVSLNGIRYFGYTTRTARAGEVKDPADPNRFLQEGEYLFPDSLPIGDYIVVANPTKIVDNATGQLVDAPAYNPQTREGVTRNDLQVNLAIQTPPQANVTLKADDPATPINEATIVIANPVNDDADPNNDELGLGDLVQIAENQTAGANFRLTSSPQPVVGEVREDTNDPANPAGNPIAGATVTAALASNATTIVAQGTTDANGRYQLALVSDGSLEIPEGTYIITATAPGYSSTNPPSARPQVTVLVGGDRTQPVTAETILLEKLPPGSVSGLVRGQNGNADVGIGAVIRLFPVINGTVSDTPLKDAAGNDVTATVGAVQTAADGYQFNWQIDNVPAGTYVATVEKEGFASRPTQSAQFAVTSGNTTRNINFTLEPPKVYGQGIQLISTPLNYSGVTPQEIFGLALNADNNGNGTPGDSADQNIFNTFDVAEWRTDRYVKLSEDASLRITPGEGYFVNFASVASIARTDVPAVEGDSVRIPLSSGWSLIGHPFSTIGNVSIPAAPIVLSQHAQVEANGEVITWDQAVARGYVQNRVFYYTGSNSGSQYISATDLQPWLGYWVRNTARTATGEPLQIFLILNRPASRAKKDLSKVKSVAELMTTRQRSITSKGELDWRLQIAARQGDLVDTDNTIGVAPGAKDGFDNQFDTQKPPIMTRAAQVYLAIDGKNETGRAAAFTDDIRSGEGTAARSWEFTVQATGEGKVTVFWPNTGRLPRGIEPMLTDLATGRRVPMRNGASSYSFTPESATTTRRFRVDVARPSSLPLAILNVKQTRIGSSNGDSRATGGFRFTFTVTRAADVSAQVETLTGRKVQEIQTRATASVEQSVVWNGRSQSGDAVAAGPYVLTLSARDSEGRITRVRLPLIILR